LRTNVTELLRNALLEGRFEPGEELSDSTLSAEFGVSRGPVREALLILAEKGLLVHNHYRGFRVPALSDNDLRQISAARQPLEVLALQQARQHITPASLSELAALKAKLLDAYATGGISQCAQPDYAFHSRIWKLSGNPWISAALKRISTPYFIYVAAFKLERKGQSLQLMDDIHQAYLDYLSSSVTTADADAVTAAASDAAEDCVASHLNHPEAETLILS
jgi:DNA-binding GntR family transcriptional regulator